MAKEKKQDMTFLDHLEELRFRLMRSVLAVLVFAIAAFMAKDFMFDKIIFGPTKSDFFSWRMWCELSHLLGLGEKLCTADLPSNVQSTTVMGAFSAHIMVSIITGIILAFPYLFFEVWGFIRPGLKNTEKNSVKGIWFFTNLLFFLGVGFGYFMITPLSLKFLLGYKVGIVNMNPTIISYMKLVASVSLASGLIFQLPILVYFLSKMGLVTPDLLKKFRKHALVVVLIIAAIITPPDVFSQILVAFPVLILYEVSIYISKRVHKQSEKNA